MARLAWSLGLVLVIAAGVFLALDRHPPAARPPGEPALAADPRERLRQSLLLLGERGEKALPDVPMLVALLAHEDVLTAWLAADALGKVGPAAAPLAEQALQDAHAAREDAAFRFVVERALRSIAGWVRFRHEVPEEITFFERPYLKVVEEAVRRGWLKGADVEVAERCWKQTLEHRRRLRTDRLFRLGEQTHAYVAARRKFEFEFEALWSPPFLLCASDGRARVRGPERPEGEDGPRTTTLAVLEAGASRFDELLAGTAKVVQSVYARMQREYGAALGLRPLEDEYGGRPDYSTGVRSYSDGFPIVVWVWSSPRAYAQATRARNEHDVPGEMLLYVLLMNGRPMEVVAKGDGTLDPERAALAATTALLHSWRRQAANWRTGFDHGLQRPFWFGVGALLAGEEHAAALHLFRSALAVHAAAARKFVLAEVPWMPAFEFLRASNFGDVEAWATRQGLPPGMGRSLHNTQSFGFARWLATNSDASHRAAFEAGLRALLRDENPEPAVSRALGVKVEEDWLPIDAAFQAWMNAQSDALGGDTQKAKDAARPR